MGLGLELKGLGMFPLETHGRDDGETETAERSRRLGSGLTSLITQRERERAEQRDYEKQREKKRERDRESEGKREREGEQMKR